MKKKFKKLFKWLIILFFPIFILGTWPPLEGKNENTGRRIFSWSGWSSLFNDKDFKLKINYYPKVEFDGIDGPYVIEEKVFNVNTQNELQITSLKETDSILVKVDNKDKDAFYVHLQNNYLVKSDKYSFPEKLVAISDIEGNFNAFSSFLINNGIVDENLNWKFGNGNLVLVGDFVDRGENVTQVLWLIYKLEQQAKLVGGRVHFVIGNHEVLNFQGNGGYNTEKYIKVAQEISGYEEWEKAIAFMYSDKTELGKWLQSKNVIEKIGDYIFVHGGLSTDLLKYELSLNDINKKTREHWDENLYTDPGNDEVANTLVGRRSPIWYRGLVKRYKSYYDKIDENNLDKILNYYSAKKIVIGHTIVSNVSRDFGGKVIRIDVKHGKEKNSSKTQGLLIENGNEYVIDSRGGKKLL